MKAFAQFATAAFLIFTFSAYAREVIELTPGESLRLENGDVVSCQQDPQSTRFWRCSILPQGSPVVKFCGFSQNQETSLMQARSNCRSALSADRARQAFCDGGWQNWRCDQIEISQVGHCN